MFYFSGMARILQLYHFKEVALTMVGKDMSLHGHMSMVFASFLLHVHSQFPMDFVGANTGIEETI